MAQDRPEVLDERVDQHGLQLEGLVMGVDEERIRELDGLLHGSPHLPEQLLRIRSRRGLHELEARCDDGEHVVEVVRDARGELREALAPCVLERRALALRPLRDVDADAGDSARPTARVAQDSVRPQHAAEARLREERALAPLCRRAGRDGGEESGARPCTLVLGQHGFEPVGAEESLARSAGALDQRVVDELDSTARVCDHAQQLHVLEEREEAAFVLGAAELGLLQCAHVGEDPLDGDGVAGRVPHHAAGVSDPSLPIVRAVDAIDDLGCHRVHDPRAKALLDPRPIERIDTCDPRRDASGGRPLGHVPAAELTDLRAQIVDEAAAYVERVEGDGQRLHEVSVLRVERRHPPLGRDATLRFEREADDRGDVAREAHLLALPGSRRGADVLVADHTRDAARDRDRDVEHRLHLICAKVALEPLHPRVCGRILDRDERLRGDGRDVRGAGGDREREALGVANLAIDDRHVPDEVLLRRVEEPDARTRDPERLSREDRDLPKRVLDA
ncbi:hypothetical protein BH09PAT4_BH09PAT4_09000 [soil metagenome]